MTAVAPPPGYSFPPPPAGCRLQVQCVRGRLHVIYPPPPARESIRVWFAGACLAGVAILAALAACRLAPSYFVFLCVIPLLIAAVASLACWRVAGRPHTELTVEDGRLLVDFGGTLWPRRSEWGLHEIRLISTPPLRIVGEHSENILDDCSGVEMRWVADLLHQVIADNAGHPPVEVAPRTDELEVEFTAGPEQSPTTGFLHVRPGVLTLRRDFLTRPRYTFFAAPYWTPGVWWRAWTRREYAVFPADLSCRVEEDGSACARFAGPRHGWPTVLFWCADKDALEQVLARFWGAVE